MSKNQLMEIITERNKGHMIGIPSFCSSNDWVIEALLQYSKETGNIIVIEATANQVNQFGGYMNMTPKEFMETVLKQASKMGVDEKKIVFGGDHLGPLLWKDEVEKEAMQKANELVYLFAKAGYTKIHLDTSMKMADDNNGILSIEKIANRGVALYKSAIRGYEELCREKYDAVRPIFVIGSEVPIPGGIQEKEDSIEITKPDIFEKTIQIYKEAFEKNGCKDGWNDVIAIVVQPGVEFGNQEIFYYDRQKAKKLCDIKKRYPNIVFEGHSTDYQKRINLKNMVEDGIAILKVGPALTYAMKEGLFALARIEKELVPKEKQSNFIEILDECMLENTNNWKKYYHGNLTELKLARKYSFSDRSRYYLNDIRVIEAREQMINNLKKYRIPLNIIHSFMPIQYKKITEGSLMLDPKSLVLDFVNNVICDYEYAINL